MRRASSGPFEAYVITNAVNGRRYVGISSRGTAARWKTHLKGYRRAPTPLAAAIRKHGREAFAVEHIASARSWVDLQEIERALIEQLGTHASLGRGYNLTLGGDGGFGVVQTEEHKRKNALTKIGNRHAVGASRSAEFKQKISVAHKGRTKSDAHRENLRKANLGKTLSVETRAKISALQTGKKRNATDAVMRQVAALAEMNKGRRVSDEERARRSQIARNSEKLKAHLARVRQMRWGSKEQMSLDLVPPGGI